MRLVLIAFALSAAYGQTDRVFQLTEYETRQDLQEIATLIRATTNIAQVFSDDTKRTVTVEGTAAQIAMAGWLVQQLDLPANGSVSGVHEYRLSPASDDVVRVLYVTHAQTVQQLQEIAVNLRTLGDIQRVFIYNALKAVAVRGTSAQVGMAAWLVNQFDQPGNVAAPAPHEYKLGDDVVRVFELASPQNPQQLQEMVTLIRSVADIQRLFVYNARRAMAMRDSADKVALAEWLVKELDKPAGPSGDTAQEYRLTAGTDNLVRVFYLSATEPAQLMKVAVRVRTTAGIQRLFVYNPVGALAVRGTVSQVATAERVIEEMRAQ